jgi:hypothetical protein
MRKNDFLATNSQKMLYLASRQIIVTAGAQQIGFA